MSVSVIMRLSLIHCSSRVKYLLFSSLFYLLSGFIYKKHQVNMVKNLVFLGWSPSVDVLLGLHYMDPSI